MDEPSSEMEPTTNTELVTDSKPASNSQQNNKAIEAIKALGGRVKLDDSGIARSVNLDYSTKLTDAGLAHLRGLTSLTTLNLSSDKITDAGLAHLKGLTNLTTLNLSGTKITDAGLVHLKGLANLTWLKLISTRVSYAGVKELQASLPDCKIKHHEIAY
ncbi:hypothetical protein N8590_01620 [bacterium]|nr:hypothetical protein [bacterium]MDB4731698.1 hypothetical protein [bacterium]MDB4793033.1 hypothetical protein [bacterium]